MLSQCWVTDESLLSHSGKYFVASNLNITFCCINFSHLILVLSNAAEQCWDANTFINFPLRDHSSEKDFQACFVLLWQFLFTFAKSCSKSNIIGLDDLVIMWRVRHLVVKTSTSIYLLQTSVSCSVTTITAPSIGEGEFSGSSTPIQSSPLLSNLKVMLCCEVIILKRIFRLVFTKAKTKGKVEVRGQKVM